MTPPTTPTRTTPDTTPNTTALAKLPDTPAPVGRGRYAARIGAAAAVLLVANAAFAAPMPAEGMTAADSNPLMLNPADPIARSEARPE